MGIAIEELKKHIAGDVDTTDTARASHAKDASLFEIVPEAVVYPKNTEDVSNLVRYVAEQRKAGVSVSLAPRSAGTCMAGGSLTASLSVDMMRYFGSIGDIVRTSPTSLLPHFFGAKKVATTAEISLSTGVFYRDLESKLSPE
jgi:FAD/FMN-containing dehydrogenase